MTKCKASTRSAVKGLNVNYSSSYGKQPATFSQPNRPASGFRFNIDNFLAIDLLLRHPATTNN